jgi:hypothetical protein
MKSAMLLLVLLGVTMAALSPLVEVRREAREPSGSARAARH